MSFGQNIDVLVEDFAPTILAWSHKSWHLTRSHNVKMMDFCCSLQFQSIVASNIVVVFIMKIGLFFHYSHGVIILISLENLFSTFIKLKMLSLGIFILM